MISGITQKWKRELFYDFKILLVVVILAQTFHITHQYLFESLPQAWPEGEKSLTNFSANRGVATFKPLSAGLKFHYWRFHENRGESYSFLLLVKNETVLSYFYFINVLAHSMEEFLPFFPHARGRISWRDMLCMTALKTGLPVAIWQLFLFCLSGKRNCNIYKFKFFTHFLLEVFPRNLLRSFMDC